MADWSRFRRPNLGRCPHDAVLSTTNAGLERQVCETCGHVSVRFVEETVRIFPGAPAEATPAEATTAQTTPANAGTRRRTPCSVCGEQAWFLVPDGFACGAHAWLMASNQELTGGELWIPIRIDQASNAPG